MTKNIPQIQPQVNIIETSQKQFQIDEENQKKFSDDCIRLDFQKVCLDVKTPGGIKRILNDISGYVCPGEIMYIMGPSGGGKTTLLDFLCNRTKTDPQNFLYMNGQKWNESQFKKISRYCQQYPLLYEILTVQETLEYAAKFATENKTQTSERVDRAISLLGLQNQRDTKVGGLLFRGISGGQKKRVSIGEELVANPKILFLDEPTSGLDSASAYQLMENLKQICRQTGICVIASIHQPSQRVFDISDRLLILAGGKGFGGNVAYFGKTSNIDGYFKNSGIVNDSKASTSEWILDQVNGDFGEAEQIQRILDYYKNSEQYKELEQIGQQLEQKGKNTYYIYKGEYTKQSSLQDIMTLLHRGYKNNIKNPLALAMRVVVYCAMAFVIGTVWWQVGDKPDAGNIMDINGALYFAAAFFMMMTISVLPINIEDRQIMVKEKTNGAYQLYCYSIASFLVSVPIAFLVSLLPGLLVHFMLGLPSEDVFMFVLNLFVCIMAAEGLMLIISTIFDHLLICIVLVAQFLGSFMIMNGFFIKKSNIPDGWIWLHYSAFNTYTFQNFMHLVYKNLTVKKNLEIVPPALEDFPGELILKDLDIEDADEFLNFIYIIGFMILFRLISYLYSRYKHTGKK